MDVFSINQLILPSTTLEEKHVQELVGVDRPKSRNHVYFHHHSSTCWKVLLVVGSRHSKTNPWVPDSNTRTTPLTLPSSHNADRLPSGPLPLFHTVLHFSPPLSRKGWFRPETPSVLQSRGLEVYSATEGGTGLFTCNMSSSVWYEWCNKIRGIEQGCAVTRRRKKRVKTIMPDFLCWEGMALPPAILSIFLFASNHTEWDIFDRELPLRTTHNQATLVFLYMCLSLHMHHQHSHFTYLPIPKHICIYMSYRCIVVKHILSNPHATHAVLSLGTETYVFCQLTCTMYNVEWHSISQ